MPVVVDPDPTARQALLDSLPSGSHSVEDSVRVNAWLAHRPEEYVVLVGPNVPLHEAVGLADGMRLTRPSTSVVLVRDEVDATTLREGMQAGIRDVVPTG